MKRFLLTRVAIVLFAVFYAQTVLSENHEIYVHNAWVREAPPNVNVLAAYLTIENTGNQLRVLTGASSPSFERVEIHRTQVHEGMARMEHQEKVDIAPKAQMVFKPGAYHFMLLNWKSPLHVGDQIELTLVFKNSETKKVTAEVRRGGGHRMSHPHKN